MNLSKTITAAFIIGVLITPFNSIAEEGNWKFGRIYYRMICTACHKDAGGAISPATKTKAEWAAYLEADSHDKGKDKVSYYVSKEYRESIKDSNRAAAKFMKNSDEELMANIRAFVIHGAKDSPNPARCN